MKSIIIKQKLQLRVRKLKTSVIRYVKKNRIKLGLIITLILILATQDFSINLNYRSPFRNSQHTLHKGKKDGVIIENANDKKQKSARLFNLSSLSLFKSKGDDMYKKIRNLEETKVSAFFRRFGHVAINEQKKFGIPASVILANGFVHSLAGTTDLVQKANNYFGIQCTPDWTGETIVIDGICYRKYESAWTSFRDHSTFITNGNYAGLKENAGLDANSWATGLEQAQFSDINNLAKLLTTVIEEYGLDGFSAGM